MFSEKCFDIKVISHESESCRCEYGNYYLYANVSLQANFSCLDGCGPNNLRPFEKVELSLLPSDDAVCLWSESTCSDRRIF